MIAITFVQSTPASTWIVPHNFNGYPPCDVVVLDNGQVQKILPLSVRYTGLNEITITFTSPRTGNVRVLSILNQNSNAGTIDPPQADAEVGTFASAASSPAPLPQDVVIGDRTFATTPGTLEFFDNFLGTGNLTGRYVEAWAPSASYPAPLTTYTWTDSGTSPVASGGVTLDNGNVSAAVATTDEYDMPDGMFIRSWFNAPTTASTFVFGVNLGFTNLSIVAGGTDGGYENHIRMDVTGFNGAVDMDGSLLPADPLDTTGLTSQSYTLDRFYSVEAGDWRNKELKLTITTAELVSQLILTVDGITVLKKNTRFPVQLFASSNFNDGSGHNYSAAYSNFGMFSSGSTDDITVQYIQVGTLGTSASIPT